MLGHFPGILYEISPAFSITSVYPETPDETLLVVPSRESGQSEQATLSFLTRKKTKPPHQPEADRNGFYYPRNNK